MPRHLRHHLSAFVNKNPIRSAYARHLLENNHLPDKEEALHVENNYKLQLALEEIEIAKNIVREGRILVNRCVHITNLVQKTFCTSPFYECTEI